MHSSPSLQSLSLTDAESIVAVLELPTWKSEKKTEITAMNDE